MIPVADPFMAGHTVERRPGDFRRDRFGTPRVSDPAGTMTKPKNKKDPGHIKWQTYSRPSNFGKIVEDMYSVTKWSERQEAYGFAVAPELVERARVLIEIEDRDSEQWKDEADKIVKAAKLAAKANLSADRGTHTHALTEDDDTDRDILTRIGHGEELGLSAEVQRSLVACWREMLERDGIEILAVEVPVVNDAYRAAGTTDRIGRLTKELAFRLVTGEVIRLPAGLVVDVDVKTGQRRIRNDGTVMYWQGYAVQVFLYASGIPYDTETDTRGEWQWEIDQRWALIAHLDVLGAIDGKPSCDLILVDLEAGKRAADLCVAAKAWSNESTVFSVAQIVEGVAESSIVEVAPRPVAPSTLSPDDCNPHGIPRPQIVEGEAAKVASAGPGPTPSTLSSAGAPVQAAPLTAGGDEAIALAPSPAMSNPTVNDLLPRGGMPQHALDELEVDRLNDQRRQSYDIHLATCPVPPEGHWPLADPDRLALVDARAALCATPDEGADLSGAEHGEQWAALQRHYNDLDAAARSWLAGLIGEATRRGVDFHARRARTLRVFEIYRSLILLCASGSGSDEVARAILALVVGDVALFPGVALGHVVGSLGAAEASRFATLVDAYTHDTLESYTDESGSLRYREVAA